MQTFLPYPSFSESVRCLDYRRLGKQRVEAFQILDALSHRRLGTTFIDTNGKLRKRAWINHPATLMWVGYDDALKLYLSECISEWVSREYRNTMKFPTLSCDLEDIQYPPWLGNDSLHASHRSNLLRKFPDHYSKFGWSESPDLPYVWVQLGDRL